jgi:thiamine-monophosphate kinase
MKGMRVAGSRNGMKLSDIGELSLLKTIRERFPAASRDVVAGIGDDAAVIAPSNQSLLLTTDMMAEGVHFDLRFTTWYQVGFKLISSNVSDIYAMGGNPRFVLLDIALGRKTDEKSLESFLDGIEAAMALYRVSLIGGDLSSSKAGAAVSATLVGYARKAVMRSGAKPGDRIYVTGTLGDSACGLELLKVIGKPLSLETGERTNGPVAWSVMEPLLRRHLMPVARKPETIAGVATAMIDVSDGLFIDLTRLCDESGVGACVSLGKLPLSSRLKKASKALGIDPYRLATRGGEDYELLFTAPSRRRVAATCIGEITGSGRVFVGNDGKERPFLPEGYQHWH